MSEDQLNPRWRPASARDLGLIDKIGDSIHTNLPERPEVFAEKLSLFPGGCYVLSLGNTIVGYGVSHPWLLNDIPPLDSLLHTLPPSSNCLYVHDVAVLPRWRGRSASAQLIKIYRECAVEIGLSYLALVSVYGTQALWNRHGFKETDDDRLIPKLSSYGPTAQYMVAPVSPDDIKPHETRVW